MRSLGSQYRSCATDFGADKAVRHGGYAAREHIAPQNLRPGASSVQHGPPVLNRTGRALQCNVVFLSNIWQNCTALLQHARMLEPWLLLCHAPHIDNTSSKHHL